MILMILKHLRLFILIGCLFFAASSRAAANDKLLSLEAEMLKYMETNDRDAFTHAVEKLKDASKEEGDDRLFYKAWGNQAVYDAAHQFNANALDVVKEMMDYARQDGSIYGEFAAMHTKAMILLQMQDNDAAEKAFLEALNFRRRHFPNESAAEDLRELMKIAYFRGDIKMAKNYGNQLLAEPNVTPHHKGRTLSRLCIMAFEEGNVEEFNHIYDEMNRLEQTDGIKTVNLYTEVNYHIINGDYKQALMLVDLLAADTCAERKALIYHRLGNNDKAYEYMVQYKQISDSLERASYSREVGNLYLRMNNDRLRLEEELLANQNKELRYRFYFAVGLILILILLFFIYRRHKSIKMLEHNNSLLSYGKEGAERALKDINELSFFENKTALPLTDSVKVNKLCDHLANHTQRHCNKAVTTIFQTDFADDFEVITNSDALEKLLIHLLNDSARFTQKGLVILKCSDSGRSVRFSISDTSLDHEDKSKSHSSKKLTGEDDTDRRHSVNFNICQSICRLLRGRIWHDLEYTGGSKFCFELPKEPYLR